MNENDEKLRALLKKAVPAVRDPEPRRDLWPQMLLRMEESSLRISWMDWALAAILLAGFFLFPQAILAVLYHL